MLPLLPCQPLLHAHLRIYPTNYHIMTSGIRNRTDRSARHSHQAAVAGLELRALSWHTWPLGGPGHQVSHRLQLTDTPPDNVRVLAHGHTACQCACAGCARRVCAAEQCCFPGPTSSLDSHVAVLDLDGLLACMGGEGHKLLTDTRG